MRLTDTWIVGIMLAILLALVAIPMLGCTPPGDPQQPGVQAPPGFHIAKISGSGSVDAELFVWGVPIQLGLTWQEHGVRVGAEQELVHCSVMERAGINGIQIGAGFVPSASDGRCEEHFRPFRLGQRAEDVAIEPGPGIGPVGDVAPSGGVPVARPAPGDPGSAPVTSEK